MKSRLLKGLILGMGFTILSTGTAFAAEEIAPQKGIVQDSIIITSVADTPQADPDSPIQYFTDRGEGVAYASGPSNIDEEILKRQGEIDINLFEKNRAELEKKGIYVTHTVPMDGYIEIGITPYTDKNVEFIQSLVGGEDVRIVEGQKAEILEATIAPDEVRTMNVTTTDEANIVNAPSDGDMRILTAADSSAEVLAISDKADNSNLLLYSLGGLVLVGSAAMVARKRTSAARK